MLAKLVVFTTIALLTDQIAAQPATQPARGDTLVCTGIIDAPAHEIFEQFRTPEGIVRAWSVAKAKVDFRVGGQIRTAYNPDADLDSDKCIVNTILAFVPDQLLVIKPTPPAGSPDWLQAICKTGHNVLELQPVSPDQTRLVLTGMGFEQGDLFDKAYSFFKQGNEQTIKLMQDKLGHKNVRERHTRAWEKLKSLVGGDWIAETKSPDGSPFYARKRWQTEMNGRVVTAYGWLGGADGIRAHGFMTCGVDPSTGAVAFVNYDESGQVIRGHVRLENDNTLVFDWNVTGANDARKHFRVEMIEQSHDREQFRVFPMLTPTEAAAKPMVDLQYSRVQEVPAPYLKILD